MSRPICLLAALLPCLGCDGGTEGDSRPAPDGFRVQLVSQGQILAVGDDLPLHTGLQGGMHVNVDARVTGLNGGAVTSVTVTARPYAATPEEITLRLDGDVFLADGDAFVAADIQFPLRTPATVWTLRAGRTRVPVGSLRAARRRVRDPRGP